MQKPESDKSIPKPTPKPTPKPIPKPTPKPTPRPRPVSRARDESSGETPPSTPPEKPSVKPPEKPPQRLPAKKFETADAVDFPFSYPENSSREDELAQAIKRLEAEVEAMKVNSAGMQTAMDRKLKLYLRLIFGGMSLLGVFDIFK